MTAARTVPWIAAIASAGLTVFVGRANASRPLIAIMALWVASPFVLMMFAEAIVMRARRSPVALLDGTMIVVSVVSVAIYTAEAALHFTAKDAFVFVIVPPVSWLVVAAAAAIGGRAGPRASKPRSDSTTASG